MNFSNYFESINKEFKDHKVSSLSLASHDFKIKTNEFELRNNHLYYTLPYLEKNKISTKDFKKIVQLAIDNKLEKRLLAPKTIDQTKK